MRLLIHPLLASRNKSLMIKVGYTTESLKKLKKLESDLQDEVKEKIELFRDHNNHKLLKVHKLHGRFSDCYSFSVNYKIRIPFQYKAKNEAVLLTIGGHSIYN